MASDIVKVYLGGPFRRVLAFNSLIVGHARRPSMFRKGIKVYWFGLGAYSAFAAGLSLSMIEGSASGRWDSEIGLAVALIVLVPMTAIISFVFSAWLALRRARFRQGGYCLLAQLGLGISYPILAGGFAAGSIRFCPAQYAQAGPDIAIPAAIFIGIPALLGELAIRLGLARRSSVPTDA